MHNAVGFERLRQKGIGLDGQKLTGCAGGKDNTLGRLVHDIRHPLLSGHLLGKVADLGLFQRIEVIEGIGHDQHNPIKPVCDFKIIVVPSACGLENAKSPVPVIEIFV